MIQLPQSELSDYPRWFCLKAAPKHERLAAAGLRLIPEVQVFSPIIRFRKTTRRGPVWFVEALFPGYLFAQFLFSELHRQVNAVPGVSSIVRFGKLIALIEDAIIDEFRAAAGEGETIVLEPQLNPGDSVEIATGPFKGLAALVIQYLPAQQRVKVLLEFLGRSVEAVLPSPHVIPNAPARTLHEGLCKDAN